MAKKFYIETFGCQMNALDSEKIAGNLCCNAMEPAESPFEADVVLLNTCSVRDRAVQKVYARLGEFRRYKKMRGDVVVGVLGCMAQLEGEKILKRAPYVDIIAGPQKSHAIYALVERSRPSGGARIDLRSDDESGPPIEDGPTRRENPWRAGVTVSEGCSRSCTYCVVPKTRGKERIRSSRNILREIEKLAAEGYVEIMLLGQTVNSYLDREGGNVDFAELLWRAAQVEGIERIRFTSPHPSDFTRDLLDVMVSCPRVCNHIHLPVQSGSTKILRAMRRGYTREDYLEIVQKIVNAPRDISISTDIIVGFPGESERDFEDTLTLMETVRYDSAFSFKYSPRPNTEALDIDGAVPDEEKSRRLTVLQQRQREIQSRINQTYMGRILEVFVDGRARSRVSLTGRTGNNKIVNFDGPETLIGSFARVRITGFGPNSLKGSWLHEQGLE
ncbi:MAG: tRNA (N6-isopentenyl adenosine(37)-C2)-methylthiotransferase MiaB [Acidobacteria bacterium]|nr:tRNA (N6-isopentenyl adenosine(37)-C2)-methylthiotransferase MiaB [Acidobacteriota bacterium]